MVTSAGNIVMEVALRSPLAGPFLESCRRKIYNNICFTHSYSTHLQLDETGTGLKLPWKTHSRMNFNKRGTVGLVNAAGAGRFASTDSFFITLTECPEFNNKYVPVGSIKGSSIYTVAKIENSDKDGDRLLHPVVITDLVVAGMEPELKPQPSELAQDTVKEPKKKKKRVVLDYGEDDVDDDFKIVSAYDAKAKSEPKETEKTEGTESKTEEKPEDKVEDKVEDKTEDKTEENTEENTEGTSEGKVENFKEDARDTKNDTNVNNSKDKASEETDSPRDPDLDIATDTITFEELTKHTFLCTY